MLSKPTSVSQVKINSKNVLWKAQLLEVGNCLPKKNGEHQSFQQISHNTYSMSAFKCQSPKAARGIMKQFFVWRSKRGSRVMLF